jgi:hypothetical protein
MLGLIGGPLLILSFVLTLFDVYKNGSGPSGLLSLPEAVWELSLGIYLIAKGFRPSPILYDDGRHAGVDGPLVPVFAAGANA